MSSTKIDRLAVELAINAAHDALATETSFAWIRKSGITERAYWVGLFNGLAAITEEDTISNRLTKFLMQTISARPADDTFPSTQLGRDFAALRRGLDHSRKTETAIDRKEMETLIEDIDLIDGRWRNHVDHARHLLAFLSAAASSFTLFADEGASDRESVHKEFDKIHRAISHLEEVLRYMALLETHHKMSERFE